jgi:hypothetical protein
VAPIEISSVTVSRPLVTAFAGRNPDRTVVWLRGEHDVSTVAALSETMARAIALDDADVVVDLSDVQFMGCGDGRRHHSGPGVPAPAVAVFGAAVSVGAGAAHP